MLVCLKIIINNHGKKIKSLMAFLQVHTEVQGELTIDASSYIEIGSHLLANNPFIFKQDLNIRLVYQLRQLVKVDDLCTFVN